MANNLIPEELKALIQQYREGQGPVPWPSTGKKLSYVKYSSKRSDFLRFYCDLCHVIDDFACLYFSALR